MAYKCWETWLNIVIISFFTTSFADFTTECQRPCDCRWQSGNKAAICSNFSLKVVPANLSSDIQILDISNNNLLHLHQEAFKRVGLTNLKKLFLKDCNIETIHKSAFVTLAIMIELDLSKNKIRYLHPETFKGTEKLRLINLNNNLIDKLEDGLFRNLKFLQKVEVSNNKIVRIGSKAFVNLPQLKILRIDGNNLSHMKPETLTALRNLSGLDLHNNPWRCDCNLQSFRDWVITHNLYTPPTACTEPASIRTKLWNELDSSNFACRPTILEPLPDATIKSYEENVTLICKVVGNPPPEVVWRFNGKTIELRSFGEIRYAITENTVDLIRWINLTILHTRFNDRGNYTCVAENPGGKDEKTLTLILMKYGGAGTIAGMDADTFAIFVGCVLSILIIFGATLTVCYFTTQNGKLKRLIKTDTRSSNGEALIEGSVKSEAEKVCKIDVNPVSKPVRKFESALANTTSEISELRNTLLVTNSFLDATAKHHLQDADLPKLASKSSIKEVLIDRLSQDSQTYPPDLLSFPPRLASQISPGIGISSERSQLKKKLESPKSPTYSVSSLNSEIYSKFLSSSCLEPLGNKGYVTLPKKERLSYPGNIFRPQIFSTLNGVIPYYDNFNMKIFHGHGGNYCSLNKSEMDLGPVNKMAFLYASNDIEPAPSPAPGTPHANIPRNSLSSPNIYNQLLMLQAMSNGHVRNSLDLRPSKVALMERESLLRSSSNDLKTGYGVNIANMLSKSRNITNPPPKLRKKHSGDEKETFLNSTENATQV